MTQLRKIEAALESYFRGEGWNLFEAGDHFAECSVSSGSHPPAEVTINLTECAKAIAAELTSV